MTKRRVRGRTVFTRKSAHLLSGVERGDFVAAVLQLKTKPSRLHPADTARGRYDDFVEVHLNAMAVMSGPHPGQSWGHMAAAFGPWHRVLLQHFESELQEIDPNVTLPYWDWTVDHDASSTMWNPDLLGGDGTGLDGRVADGPFAEAGGAWPLRVLDNPQADPPYLTRFMGQAADAPALPTTPMAQTVLGATPYDSTPWEDMMRDSNDPSQWRGFRIRLEIVLHNLVHRWVGGAMLAMASPNDPVFWMHHCNIDRLWSDWMRRHQDQSPYLPLSGGPHGHNLYDAMIFHAGGAPAPWDDDARPVDVLDHHALGYTYDTDPAEEEELPMGSVPAEDEVPPSPEHPMPMPMHARTAERVAAAPAQQRLPIFALKSEIAALSDEDLND
jgi:tyrosinase